MASLTSCRQAAIIFVCVGLASASSFLSRAHADTEAFTPELQSDIVHEVDMMLASGDQQDTKDRLERIEDMLRTTFQSMPKNSEGKLHHASVRYTLHSYFVQRHGWFVRGLANMGDVSNDSSLVGILQDKVEEFVLDTFERRLTDGLDLREMSVLVATYENLVHHEAMHKLNTTYKFLMVRSDKEIPMWQADQVIDTYMIGYILGLNYSQISPSKLHIIESNIKKVLPGWEETKKFLRTIRERKSFHRSFLGRPDVEAVLEEAGDQYGRWQDRECRDLKQQLLALEDRSIGTNGSGRVRLVDFYGSALKDGNWQFSETQDYLQKLGALDTHDPSTPRVIIPNYVNSPSNCLASSKFYSVCCINECEDLMDHLEHRFAAPSADPADILDFVSSLPSSSVPSGRTLHPILASRLTEIASHHSGRVPLHGRLFAQWMHHAYPRECPYPHMSGTTRPQTVKEYKAESNKAPTVTKAQMQTILDESKPTDADNELSEECTKWSLDEEIYVGDGSSSYPARPSRLHGAKGFLRLIRPFAYLSVALAAAFALARRSLTSGSSAAVACGFGGKVCGSKDVYV